MSYFETKVSGVSNGKRSSRTRNLILFSIAILALTAIATTAAARDRDGSKIQARTLKLSSTHSDSLTPPTDMADWFYVKVDSNGRIKLQFDADHPLNVAIFNSSNQQQWQSNNANGPVTTNLEVEPGIYFISVAAGEFVENQTINYKLRVSE